VTKDIQAKGKTQKEQQHSNSSKGELVLSPVKKVSGTKIACTVGKQSEQETSKTESKNNRSKTPKIDRQG
jgi:hypothetical protein